MKRADVPEFGCLRSLRIVNCSAAIAGPVLATLFAEQGADVVNIENTRAPDMFRAYPYGWPMERRNVRTICMDVFSQGGGRVFEKMLADTDILILSGKGDVWTRKGFTDEQLWSLNSRMIIVHITGFGLTGVPAYVNAPSYDQNGQTFSGFTMLNADADGPVQCRPYTSDYFTALFGAWSALAAYIRMEETGVGESIDLAQYEAALRVQGDFSGIGLNTGEMPPVRERTSSMFHRTKDEQWRLLFPMPHHTGECLRAIGMDDSDGVDMNAVYIDHFGAAYKEIIFHRIREYCAGHTAEEIDGLLQHHWLVSPVMTYEDMLTHPHYLARENITEFYSPTLETNFKGVAPVPKFANNPSRIWRGGPVLAADNDDILEELGFSSDEIARLYDAGSVKK